MNEFFKSFIGNWVFLTITFFLCSRAASFFLFNSQHGTITDWTSRLARLKVRLPENCVSFTETAIELSAPFPIQHVTSIETFLKHHRIVEKVRVRLVWLKSYKPYVIAAIIWGISGGFAIASPILTGQPPLSLKISLLSGVLTLFAQTVFALLVSLPHVHWFNDLKELAEQTKSQ